MMVGAFTGATVTVLLEPVLPGWAPWIGLLAGLADQRGEVLAPGTEGGAEIGLHQRRELGLPGGLLRLADDVVALAQLDGNENVRLQERSANRVVLEQRSATGKLFVGELEQKFSVLPLRKPSGLIRKRRQRLKNCVLKWGLSVAILKAVRIAFVSWKTRTSYCRRSLRPGRILTPSVPNPCPGRWPLRGNLHPLVMFPPRPVSGQQAADRPRLRR
mgnify:CR=1 FL=1